MQITVKGLQLSNQTASQIAHAHLRGIADFDGAAVHELVVVVHRHAPPACKPLRHESQGDPEMLHKQV